MESFTQCAVRQYTHRAEGLSLLHIYADMGARLGDNSTKLPHHLAESRRLYTLTKTKKLLGSLYYMLILEVYSFLTFNMCSQAGGVAVFLVLN